MISVPEIRGLIETCFCPVCMNRLDYDYLNYGHVGRYNCKNCGFQNPPYNYKVSISKKDGEYHFSIASDGEILGMYVLDTVVFTMLTTAVQP